MHSVCKYSFNRTYFTYRIEIPAEIGSFDFLPGTTITNCEEFDTKATFNNFLDKLLNKQVSCWRTLSPTCCSSCGSLRRVATARSQCRNEFHPGTTRYSCECRCVCQDFVQLSLQQDACNTGRRSTLDASMARYLQQQHTAHNCAKNAQTRTKHLPARNARDKDRARGKARKSVAWSELRIRRMASGCVSRDDRITKALPLDWVDLYLSLWFEYLNTGERTGLTEVDRFSASPSPFELCHLANANAIRKSKQELLLSDLLFVTGWGLRPEAATTKFVWAPRFVLRLCNCVCICIPCMELFMSRVYPVTKRMRLKYQCY